MAPISHWSVTNNDWDRIGISFLEEQNSSLHNQIHADIMNPKAKYLKEEEFKIYSRMTPREFRTWIHN